MTGHSNPSPAMTTVPTDIEAIEIWLRDANIGENGARHIETLCAEVKALRQQVAEVMSALKPLASLEVSSRSRGNAGLYGIYHADIETARAALKDQSHG